MDDTLRIEELSYYNAKVDSKPRRKGKGKQRRSGPVPINCPPEEDPTRQGIHLNIPLKRFIQLTKNPRWCGNWLDSATIYSAGLPFFIQ